MDQSKNSVMDELYSETFRDIKEGEIVTAGQSIGTIGKSGRVDSPQLHFEIRKSRQPVDPRSLIS